jgi:PPIC-type PPIASE domain
VNRRATVVPGALAALAALGALTLAGCSTFEQADAAARVGDRELPQDELDDMIRADTEGASEDGPFKASAQDARNLTQDWVITRLLEDDVAANGGEITDDDRAAARTQLESQEPGWADIDPILQELYTDQLAALTVWQGIASTPPSDDELRALYDAAIEASGIACTAQILVETEAEAQAILDDLAAGGDFAELAAEHSIDPASSAEGGVIPCEPAGSFVQSYVPEYVEAALAADVGVPTGPVASEFGYHVILVRPYDDVADEGIAEIYADPRVRFQRLAADADVYVDPRVGTFDPSQGIVALR